jgi:transcriptional regulator with XRE-family HTH domain
MNEIKECTAENLHELRRARGMNQDAIATILGLAGYHISNIEKGRRALSSAEKALLDLYFFGKIPFTIVNEKMLTSVLEFSPRQWDVIRILANKAGKISPGEWIAQRIRDYLSFNEQARDEARLLEEQPIESCMLNDDRARYRVSGEK